MRKPLDLLPQLREEEAAAEKPGPLWRPSGVGGGGGGETGRGGGGDGHAARASLPLQGLGKTSEPGARGGRAHGRSGPPGILFYFLSPTLSIGFRFSLGANRLGP